MLANLVYWSANCAGEVWGIDKILKLWSYSRISSISDQIRSIFLVSEYTWTEINMSFQIRIHQLNLIQRTGNSNLQSNKALCEFPQNTIYNISTAHKVQSHSWCFFISQKSSAKYNVFFLTKRYSLTFFIIIKRLFYFLLRLNLFVFINNFHFKIKN